MKKLCLLFILILTSCHEVSPSQRIDRYEYDDVRSYHIRLEEVFLHKEESYYIYFYQVDCYFCHGIKTKMIDFALHNGNIVYFVEVDKKVESLSFDRYSTLNTSDYRYAFANVTPQLSLVVSHVIKETYIGQQEILIIIE